MSPSLGALVQQWLQAGEGCTPGFCSLSSMSAWPRVLLATGCLPWLLQMLGNKAEEALLYGLAQPGMATANITPSITCLEQQLGLP